jgi:hypothetical protein
MAKLPSWLHPDLLRGLELFDAGDYHAAHDAIEELWLDEVGRIKSLCKALIQLAVGLYHRENGNVRGARKLLRRAADLFETLPSPLLELDVEDLTARATALASEVEQEPPPATYREGTIPRFTEHLEAARRERRRLGLEE